LNLNRLVLISAVLISVGGTIAAVTGIFFVIGDYQVGRMTMGWGLFVIGLAWFGVRRFNRASWIMLWVVGIPAMIISTLPISFLYKSYLSEKPHLLSLTE